MMKIESAIGPRNATLGAVEPAGLGRILELLASHHGLRSRAYKKGTLCRRAERRMRLAGLSELPAYATYLEHHREELAALYHDVLVGVTRFFRNQAQWEYLAQAIVPSIVRAHRDPRRPIRVWSAGCASGEEAYGLAMVFLEQLERCGSQAELQVFASDVDEEAVRIARRGTYPRSIARDVPPDRLARFFVEQGETYQIARPVLETVYLCRHDLFSDPPFAWLDLVACRNLLVYLQPRAQRECIRRFHFSLLSRGVLWLGNAESIDPRNGSFQVITPGRRMYQRTELKRRMERPWSASTPTLDAYLTPSPVRTDHMLAERYLSKLARPLELFVLAHRTAACVVIDRLGHMLRSFGPTADYLVHPRGDVRPELLTWVGPGLHGKLRAALDQALEGSETMVVTGAHVQRGDRVVPITCTIEPIPTVSEGLWLVTFGDEAAPPARGEAVPDPESGTQGADPLVQRLTLELQETQAELRSLLDDVASATQARQAGYEQLASLNEELVATNDTLELAKAEAQALNEELLTLNRELEERNVRLRAAYEAAVGSDKTRLSTNDVTRLRDAETRWRAQELERQHREHELLAMLGPELRDPLAALVDGLTSLQQTSDPDATRAVLPTLVQHAARMTSLLDRFLHLSGVTPAEHEITGEHEITADHRRSPEGEPP